MGRNSLLCKWNSTFRPGRPSASDAVDIYKIETQQSNSGGDPHFYGFMGQKYDVMGQSYEIYNIITSPSLQINSRFIPYYKTLTQSQPTGTMMGELGIKFNKHRFFINSNSTIAELDGQNVDMRESWTVVLETVKLSNIAKKNTYEFTVTTPQIEITFVRKVYLVAGIDAQYHFDYKANLLDVDVELHG